MSEAATAILSMASTPPPVTEAPVVETTDTTVPADGAVQATETPQGGDQQVAQPGQPPAKGQIHAALKAFRDGNPEHAAAARALNDAYGRFEGYKSVFPSVEEARAVKAQLETFGGFEGISQMQSTLASVDETDALLEAGDPQVLDRIIEDAPEGFKKLAPHYLQRLQKSDPEMFGRTLQPYFVRSLADANFPGTLEYLASLVKDKPEALNVVRNMHQWFEGQKSDAERQNQDALNPERQKLSEESERVGKESRRVLQEGISMHVTPHIQQELGSRLKQYSESLNKFPEAVRMNIAQAAVNELGAALEADKAYQTQIDAMMGARKPDREKIVQLNKSKVTALADRVIEAVAKRYNLTPGQAKPAPKQADKDKGTPKQNTQILKISAKPSDADIDWEYPDAQKAFLLGRARMKTGPHAGRFVQWR